MTQRYNPRPMSGQSSPIPLKVDPFRLAERDQRMEGRLDLSGMKRLVGLLASHEGEVKVGLHFHINERGWPVLEGEIFATLSLECQRCLEAFDWTLHRLFLMVLVRHESEMDVLPDDIDTFVVEQTPMMLSDIIEDEMILSLPTIARHEQEDCPAQTVLQENYAEPETEQEQENPFSVLEKLKTPKDEA